MSRQIQILYLFSRESVSNPCLFPYNDFWEILDPELCFPITDIFLSTLKNDSNYFWINPKSIWVKYAWIVLGVPGGLKHHVSFLPISCIKTKDNSFKVDR